jgi:hypothetical protein
VLNGEITCLAKERVKLQEEISFCKLALSSKVTAERRME